MLTEEVADALARLCYEIVRQKFSIDSIWFAYLLPRTPAPFPVYALLVVVPDDTDPVTKSETYQFTSALVAKTLGPAETRAFYVAVMWRHEINAIPGENRIPLV